MFDRKRKTGQYRFLYGKSPILNSSTPKQGFHTSSRAVNKPHPTLNKIKKFSTLIIIIAGICFASYSIFFSNYFIITDVNLKDKALENQSVAEKIRNSIHSAIGKNILFADTKNLETAVLSAFPALEKVSITKSYPHELLIEFAEYPLVANIINESTNLKKSYIINAVGFVIKENYEDKTLPYIRIQSEEPLNPKNAIIEPAKLSYILDASKYFEDKFGIRIVEVIYKPVAREIHLITERDFAIWIDVQRPFDQQLKKLKKALVKLDIYKDNFSYIDLRIAGENGDKIIYKRK